MPKRFFLLLLMAMYFLALCNAYPALAIEKAAKITDRELLESLVELKAGQKSLQRQMDDLKEQMRDLKTFMLWGFGILFGGMGILIGFVIWDRRTALAPAISKNKELEEREERIEKALREYAKKEPGLAEILKNLGLM